MRSWSPVPEPVVSNAARSERTLISEAGHGLALLRRELTMSLRATGLVRRSLSGSTTRWFGANARARSRDRRLWNCQSNCRMPGARRRSGRQQTVNAVLARLRVRVLADGGRAAHVPHAGTLGQFHVGFTQLGDDLLGGMALRLYHVCPPASESCVQHRTDLRGARHDQREDGHGTTYWWSVVPSLELLPRDRNRGRQPYRRTSVAAPSARPSWGCRPHAGPLR